MSTAIETSSKPISVGMGELKVAESPGALASVLGSCIGVVIYHTRKKVAALAHVMLPEQAGREGPPGKFADTAVPAMLDELLKHQVPNAGLVAKISGGANMFGNSGPMQIGQANAEAVKEALLLKKIPLVGEDVGGAGGRRVKLDCETGLLTIACIGKEDITL